MKKLIYLNLMLVTFLVSAFSSISLAQWQVQNSGTNLALTSVYFVDNETGWAVGAEGMILNTNDGGEIWVQQNSGTILDLESVHFFDHYLGWAVGGIGDGYSERLILRTQNGGMSWDTVYLDSDFRLTDIFFVDSVNGWAVGKKGTWPWEPINLRTQDGGETWEEFVGPDENYSVYFIDTLNGWIAGGGNNGSTGYPYGYIYKTNDGGNTWTEQAFGSAIDEFGHLRSVFFIDPLNGWAVGGNPGFMPPYQFSTLLHTSDGGLNWEIENNLTDLFLKDVFFTDSLKGWIVGGLSPWSENIILNTENGGEFWQQQPCEVNKALNSVCFVDSEKGWIVGDNGIILHTENGGGNYCLPEGITFTTQMQIDSFQVNYPGCTEIEGDVTINDGFPGNNITNMNGLYALTSIDGNFTIWNIDLILDLSGLDNLVSIGGYLDIDGNDLLQNMSELSNLTTIGGDLWITYNTGIVNLAGMENLTAIGGDLWIWHNNGLTSLTGLESLDASTIDNLNIHENPLLATCDLPFLCNYLLSPGGTVNIIANAPGCYNPPEIASECGINMPCLPYGDYNFRHQSDIDNFQSNYPGCTELNGTVHIWGDDISNLYGLETIASIEEDIYISQTGIQMLTGMENLTTVGGSFQVSNNYYLQSIAGFENATSLNTIDIMSNSSLISVTGFENLTFLNSLSFQGNDSLEEITAFENLDSLGGTLRISFNDELKSLSGLHNIAYIGGGFMVYNNDSLTDLSGLSSLHSIAGDMEVFSNGSLESFTGLENLASIGGILTIGYWHQYPYSPYGNASLTSLEALQNLVSIGSLLRIEDNDLLGSLSGVDNIGAGSIANLYIHHNDTLAVCDVAGICAYLVSPGGTLEIYANESGCNNPEEVQEACMTGVEEIENEKVVTIFPNPSNDKITISSHAISGNTQLSIFNVGGEKVLERQLTDNETQIDISALPPGVYFVQVQADREFLTKKIIKSLKN